jgi:hypothetical protein
MLNHAHLWDEFPAGQSDLEDEGPMVSPARCSARGVSRWPSSFLGCEFSVTVHGPTTIAARSAPVSPA